MHTHMHARTHTYTYTHTRTHAHSHPVSRELHMIIGLSTLATHAHTRTHTPEHTFKYQDYNIKKYQDKPEYHVVLPSSSHSRHLYICTKSVHLYISFMCIIVYSVLVQQPTNCPSHTHQSSYKVS